MIDFHSHLELYKDPAAEAKRCTSEGIEILSVGTTPSAFSGTRRIGEKHQNIRTALGFHPHLAGQRILELEIFDKFLTFFAMTLCKPKYHDLALATL